MDEEGKVLSDLLARVEGATGPDRELDALIECAWRNPLLSPAAYARQPWVPMGRFLSWVSCGGFSGEMVPPYTASLDAALALCERVLPDLCIENFGEMRPGCGPLSGHWLAQLAPRQPRRRMDGPITAENVMRTLDALPPVSAATPALALCAAILRALSLQPDTRRNGHG